MLNYAETYSNELLETLVQGALTSPFITNNVRWLDAKTFHFTQMSVTGFKNHKRNGGWNQGEFNQTDVPFTVTHDRDVEFLVDKADVDETNQTASIQNISNTFEQTQVTPETDALFFSKVAAAAKKENGYHSETAAADWTVENTFSKLKKILAAGKLRRYRSNGSLIVYVTSEIMDNLEQSTSFTRKIEQTQIAEGGLGIETRITEVDGVPLMEVIDDERFYDAFDFSDEANDGEGGFEPATGAHKINVLVACLQTCKTVPKIASIYFFAPGAHTKGDGYLYQNRQLSDTFVFPNGKDGKVDSVYVDTDTVAVA
ncbi:MAG: phage capsid protein [Firmicutes bacterium]|nr:phage capsid protein [Bacillota bacterium]